MGLISSTTGLLTLGMLRGRLACFTVLLLDLQLWVSAVSSMTKVCELHNRTIDHLAERWNHDLLLTSGLALPFAPQPETAPVASVLSCTTGIHHSVVELKKRLCTARTAKLVSGSSTTLSMNCGRASRPCSAYITTSTSTTQSMNCTCRTFTVFRTVWMIGAWHCIATGTPTIRSLGYAPGNGLDHIRYFFPVVRGRGQFAPLCAAERAPVGSIAQLHRSPP